MISPLSWRQNKGFWHGSVGFLAVADAASMSDMVVSGTGFGAVFLYSLLDYVRHSLSCVDTCVDTGFGAVSDTATTVSGTEVSDTVLGVVFYFKTRKSFFRPAISPFLKTVK